MGAPATPQAPKSGRVKRMVRLAAELLLLLGLLLLTLHITVLRSSPLPQGNETLSLDQDTALTEVRKTDSVGLVLRWKISLGDFDTKEDIQGGSLGHRWV